jgi:protein TonB
VKTEIKRPAVPETAPVAEKEQKAQDNVIRRGRSAEETAGEGGFDFGSGTGPGTGGDGKGVGIGFGPGEGGGFGGYGSYLSVMRQRIWSEWSQSRVFGTKWVAVVGLTVARDGDISDIKLEKSSGDNYYDQVAVRAVRNSSPLPPLPPTAKDGQRFRIQFKLMD